MVTTDSETPPSKPVSRLRIALHRGRRVFLTVWVCALFAAVIYYATHSHQFTAADVAARLQEAGPFVLAAYLAVSVLRALVLLPSTPFVLAGAILLPESPGIVLVLSLIGIALSSTLLYYFADALGFHDDLKARHPEGLLRLERVLNSRAGFLGLVGWAFFPLAPTDAACCVAGTLRMPFWKFLLAVCLGELMVCSMYLYLGHGLWQQIRGMASLEAGS